MFGIGAGELLLILVVALIVLGPERMPKVMRDVGKVVGDLRRTSDELRADFLNADKYLEAKAAPAPETSAPATESVASGPAGESPFDREMREARERLRET